MSAMKCFRWVVGLWMVLGAMAPRAWGIEISGVVLEAGSGFKLESGRDTLKVGWDGGEKERCECLLNLAAGKPLVESLVVSGKRVAGPLQPVYRLAIGKRKKEAEDARYTFFDKVFADEVAVSWVESKLEPREVKVTGAGGRLTVVIEGLSAGTFHGGLHVNFYAGSPLVLMQGVMTQEEPDVAYSYDVILEGKFAKQSWMGLDDKLVSAAPQGEMKPQRVRFRTILGGDEAGTLAVFPPPHAYFYPKDEADNYGFVQGGERGIGIHQDPVRPKWRPLIDAPAGRYQRMGVFLLMHAGDAGAALERVQRYTHGDKLKEMEGRTTLVTHDHATLTVHEKDAKPPGPALARAVKRAGIRIWQVAEFHGDGPDAHENDLGLPRVDAYHRMHEMCRKYSDDDLLMLPGEEPNALFPGHWIVMFPKPVIFTRGRRPEQPFKEEVSGYGTVYHPGSTEEARQMLEETGGMAWTAHPRIKSSRNYPDFYHKLSWYLSDQWLGATWKSMPVDLSQGRLGVRCLDLLDDMNLWGQRKRIVGEFDCFNLNESSEIYGNLNASYLKLSRKPTIDDASPVIECLRRGDYFVTTGEVLIHDWKWERGGEEARGQRSEARTEGVSGRVVAEVEWTLPLAHAEVVMCDGKVVQRETIAIEDTKEFGRRRFEFPVTLPGAQWVRVEFWDVADDGAFGMPAY